MYECISTIDVAVLVNDSLTIEFPIRRGLLQSDPISPFLFLMVVEALHLLFTCVKDLNMFQGISITKKGLKITNV